MLLHAFTTVLPPLTIARDIRFGSCVGSQPTALTSVRGPARRRSAPMAGGGAGEPQGECSSKRGGQGAKEESSAVKGFSSSISRRGSFLLSSAMLGCYAREVREWAAQGARLGMLGHNGQPPRRKLSSVFNQLQWTSIPLVSSLLYAIMFSSVVKRRQAQSAAPSSTLTGNMCR